MASALLTRTRELLETTPIPQTVIAEHCGCTTRTIVNIKAGVNIPSVELCEAIYNLLSGTTLKVQ